MATLYRALAPDGTLIGTADSIDGIVQFIRNALPGRYQIDVISVDAGSAPSSSRGWGTVTKSPGGRIEFDLPPYMD
jgi:hypothetical protein